MISSALSDYKENYSKDDGKLIIKYLVDCINLNKFIRCDKNKDTNKKEIIIKYPQSFQYDESNVRRTESYNSSIMDSNSVNTNLIQIFNKIKHKS